MLASNRGFMSSTSLVYSHPYVYEWAIRFMYGRDFEARYRAINDLIADGSDVFEACAGDGYLYRHYLSKRSVRYTGGDFNERFVAHARQNDVPITHFDLSRDTVPRADVVLIQGSLHQFMPDHRGVVDRLLGAARGRLIISEPIKNLATHHWGPIAWLARRATNPGDGQKTARFDEPRLDAFFSEYYADRIERSFVIPGGRDKVYCLRGSP
jgi:hypothetical protein